MKSVCERTGEFQVNRGFSRALSSVWLPQNFSEPVGEGFVLHAQEVVLLSIRLIYHRSLALCTLAIDSFRFCEESLGVGFREGECFLPILKRHFWATTIVNSQTSHYYTCLSFPHLGNTVLIARSAPCGSTFRCCVQQKHACIARSIDQRRIDVVMLPLRVRGTRS